MCRSLGLREDQRLGESLAQRIAGLFPLDPSLEGRRPAGANSNRRCQVVARWPVMTPLRLTD